MGMAAGQARLLSITSRMSDNELRAQLINNDKMRLATQSSQVSEAYVAALNEAQLMFTNYDADNNASYQQLSFNSLTAYNQYNNQYGLVTPSGQILVSESDALNFQNSGGDLNTFLGYYGLKETTTYFDDLAENEDPATGTIWYYNGETTAARNDDGEWYEKPVEVNSGKTAEELKSYYFGYETQSYAETVTSQKYHDYVQGLTNMQNAYNEFLEFVGPKIKTEIIDKEINNVTGTTSFTISDITNPTQKQNLLDIADKFANYVTDSGKTEINSLKNDINNLGSAKEYRNGSMSISENDTGNITYIDDSGTEITDAGPVYNVTGADGSIFFAYTSSAIYLYIDGVYSKCTSGTYSETGESGTTINYNNTLTYVTDPTSGNITEIHYAESGSDSSTHNIDLTGITYDASSGKPISGTCVASKFEPTSDTAEANEILTELQNVVYNYINPLACSTISGASTYYTNYSNAATSFYQAIFGNPPPSGFDFTQLKNPDTIATLIESAGTGTRISTEEFQNIQNALMLDNIMSTYGEPKWAWIDMTAPTDSYNENGEAKAQWYTNLFERMQKGYKVLQDGLASSTEWIQFALESGIVTMEQVDSDNHWIATNYTNCSDITEQTNNAAATLAEAEYNAAMNKIENKDKKYDLELKNIDTEHNSLQTEYDSIKSAIDKNIERTFKIYS